MAEEEEAGGRRVAVPRRPAPLPSSSKGHISIRLGDLRASRRAREQGSKETIRRNASSVTRARARCLMLPHCSRRSTLCKAKLYAESIRMPLPDRPSRNAFSLSTSTSLTHIDFSACDQPHIFSRRPPLSALRPSQCARHPSSSCPRSRWSRSAFLPCYQLRSRALANWIGRTQTLQEAAEES